MNPALKIGIAVVLGTATIGGATGITFFISQPKNLKEELEKGNHKLLDINGDENAWKDLVEKYKKEPQNTEPERINGLTIKEPSGPKTEPHLGIKQLRDECEKLFKKTKEDKNYAKYKKDAENWCTRKNVTPTLL